MKFKYLLFISIFTLSTFSSLVLAFVPDDCSYEYDFHSKQDDNGAPVGCTSPNQFSTLSCMTFLTTVVPAQIVLNIAATSKVNAQFTSSYGRCSAVDLRNKEILNFLLINYDPLRIQVAKGEGESLDALLDLIGCNLDDAEKMKVILRENYEHIFLSHQPYNSPSLIYHSLKSLTVDNEVNKIETCRKW